jgi:hypothetical protein
MANDRYQFMQGKRYACDMLETLRNLANDPKFALPVVERLEQSCANKPESFTEGVLLITRNVRRFFGGMKTNFKGGV